MLDPNMQGTQQLRGFAELLFFKGTSESFIKAVTHPSKSIKRELYYSVLKQPVPLQELDSPYDMYTMFSDVLFNEENKNHEGLTRDEVECLSECSQELDPLPRQISSGDVILIHFLDKQITKVLLLANADAYNPHTMKYFRAARKEGHALAMLDLNDHKEFQHVWKNYRPNQF